MVRRASPFSELGYLLKVVGRRLTNQTLTYMGRDKHIVVLMGGGVQYTVF